MCINARDSYCFSVNWLVSLNSIEVDVQNFFFVSFVNDRTRGGHVTSSLKPKQMLFSIWSDREFLLEGSFYIKRPILSHKTIPPAFIKKKREFLRWVTERWLEIPRGRAWEAATVNLERRPKDHFIRMLIGAGDQWSTIGCSPWSTLCMPFQVCLA